MAQSLAKMFQNLKAEDNTQVPGRRPERNNIDEDAKTIDVLVSSAKNGQWDRVWPILGRPEQPKQDRFFNVIPENRRWGILHQAVYWNNKSILEYLLKYAACDSDIRVKQCTSECGDTSGKNAVETAEAYGYKTMSSILMKHKNKLEEQVIPTLQPYEHYTQSEGLGLLSVTLAAYKKTFHPKPIDPNKSILSVLGDIFNDINRSDARWKEVKAKVCDSVYVVCQDNYRKIKQSKDRHEFFQCIINTYTEEENYMYTYLNMAFRRQKEKGYRPTGDDLALGPYAVVYQMLLLYWPELAKESGTTYRKMLLKPADIALYQMGKKFVWQSITSSTTAVQYAIPFPTCGPEGDQSVIFTIDNTTNSTCQPRNIEKYARYMEHERTYPAGAKFQVTGRTMKNSDLHISLKLLQS